MNDCPPTLIRSFEIVTGPDEIIRLQDDMERLLLSLDIDKETVSAIVCATNEMLINAMEHGHMGITFQQKQKNDGAWRLRQIFNIQDGRA